MSSTSLAMNPPAAGRRADRTIITVCAMIATLMLALDTTIANVARLTCKARCRRRRTRSPKC